MSDVSAFLSDRGWPQGFDRAIQDSKDRVAFRFVVVDNSRSMLKRDSHLVYDGDSKGSKV